MGDDQFLFREDGYLSVASESSSVIYHPNLNVVLVFNANNEVKVLDVNSGVILQTCSLSDNVCLGKVRGRYLPNQDKILFWNGKNIGLRGDYNGVLLLDTILQTPVVNNDDLVRLEMLLSEAALFQQSLQSLEEHGVECPTDVSNELLEKIKEAQTNTKKGIKAQRWNTVCIELPYTSLKLVANNVVFNLKRLDRHIPALAIASAINERLTDLLSGSRVVVSSGNCQRFLMYSEAARRQTFEKWPHMDYKWALPDQMAQAGFYHKPSTAGEDRAMCFTCNVCLVSWEKTDEPWSEHERHSPNCPFVKGEYTQNVPLSITYATNPAVETDGFDVISNSDIGNILCTSNRGAEVIIWSTERQLKKMHTFNLLQLLKPTHPDVISLTITSICVLPVGSNSTESSHSKNKLISMNLKSKLLGMKIAFGISVITTTNSRLLVAILNICDIEVKSELIVKDLDIKMDIQDKSEDEKEPFSIKTIITEEDYDNEIIKLSDFAWKSHDEEKPDFFSNNQSFSNDVSTQANHSALNSSEKMDSKYFQSKNEESECITLLEEYFLNDEIDCQLVNCIQVQLQKTNNNNIDCVYIISEMLPTSERTQLIVKLDRIDSETEMRATNDDCKMEVDEEEDEEVAESDIYSQLLLLPLTDDELIVERPNCFRNFSRDSYPIEICMLPVTDNCGRKICGPDAENGLFCAILSNGSLELIGLNFLNTVSQIHPKDEQFVSATYCKSLKRLCGCTENGSLIFYSLHDNEGESGDERAEDENAFLLATDTSLTGGEQDVSVTDGPPARWNVDSTYKSHIESTSGSPQTNLFVNTGDSTQASPLLTILAHKNDLSIDDLKALYSLTLFDEMLTPYTAEVPSCWNELVQAQIQRKHPLHLRPGDDTHLTKAWRLHNDATTWDEHVIEITLTKPPSLGHIDLKFSLYQQCPNPPAIQVTLLKQNTSGFGYRMKPPHTINMSSGSSTDENFEYQSSGNESPHENPVLSEEYLHAHNAEILAGPIELSSCMDLCDQGGLVTLTSPKLFKTRARNFLLHIKTMVDPSKDGQGKTRVPIRKKGVMRFLLSSFANNSSQNSTNVTYSPDSSSAKKSRKKDYYIGCDWLHEISITVRSTKNENKISNDRLQRIAMLESNNYLQNLLRLACDNSSRIKQNIGLDILIWLCTIRMARFRSPKIVERSKAKAFDFGSKSGNSTNSFDNQGGIDMGTQQKDCVTIVEANLKNLIESCIINGNRSMAHKAVKIILILSEGVRNLPTDIQSRCTFDVSLKEAINSSLPNICKSKYASSVRWFTLLVCGTSTPDSHSAVSEKCIKLLTEITKEINHRWNPYSSLLGSRFGLYGFPFEPEIFDIELPLMTKSCSSTPTTLANIIKSNAGLLQPNAADLKKMCSIDGVEFRSFPHLIKRKGISNQLRGLLEVEPLHFTCFAASEATRIENMDSLTSSTASNINMEEIMLTPMQNNIDGSGDSKKDVDKDNMDFDSINNVENVLVDKFFDSTLKKHKLKADDSLLKNKPNGIAEPLESPQSSSPPSKYSINKLTKSICQYLEENVDESCSTEDTNIKAKFTDNIQKYLNENNLKEGSNVYAWHKLLVTPPKQMVVIERIHSGARRYVVIDFGSPVLLTDIVIPACDELASLFIDIWCFEEETDSIRLAVTRDIGVKTLVLSDIQPPPICRFMKITIIGRYGMSATKCKIPIGSFYGHILILETDAYADSLMRYMKSSPSTINSQVKALNCLYEDVHCRYSLSSSKLLELLAPGVSSEMSNIAHMQAYFNKQKDEDQQVDNNKIVNCYEECINLQQQMNIIRNVINQLENSLNSKPQDQRLTNSISSASSDKLRVLSECLVEILLHFTIEYGLKNIFSLHSLFTMDVANILFNTLVVYGDAHIQLATCSLLVRMCCFQSWWGDFLANIFRTLYSSQNSKIFPQDRVFFLLTYLGRKSIAVGTCSSIVIDAVLKTLAKLLAPLSPRYNSQAGRNADTDTNDKNAIWTKSDLQLITWLLLFLSVCLDDSAEKKDKSSARWEFMSCEADFTKSKPQTSSNSGKSIPRCFKKRIIQQNKLYGLQPYTDWGKKIYMLQNELPEIFMELTGKPRPKTSKSSASPKIPKKCQPESESSFDRGLKSIKLVNILVVIRGLIGLLLEMDFTCSMDLFLLTCKVIARLVSACRPSIQLSKVISTNQLEQLVRLAVWNDQQQPWAVHAVNCLLQDLLDADKNFKESNISEAGCSDINSMEEVMEADEGYAETEGTDKINTMLTHLNAIKDFTYAEATKYGHLPSLIECDDADIDEFLNDIHIVDRMKNLMKKENSTHNKNSFNFFCKGVSSTLDARLDYGLDINVEIPIRRLTMISSMDLYASLPQILANETINTNADLGTWPEYVIFVWCGPEYNGGLQSHQMLKIVFDNIFSNLHLQDTWVHLEQVLQMWLSLNSELADKSYNSGIGPTEVPKIQFGTSAVQGLLQALAWHGDIKLRTWCLGFQCLILASNAQPISDSTKDEFIHPNIGDIIIRDPNFEKMLLRFFSGYGLNNSNANNRCVSNQIAGPTICKYLHEFLLWLQMKAEFANSSMQIKKRLKDILLYVVLQLIQPGGAISNQQGPVDAQSQLIRDLISITYDKADLTIAMSIVDSVSFLVYNNISNAEKIYCYKQVDANSSNNAFGSLFATVLGADSSKQCPAVSDNNLIILLLKLSASLVQMELDATIIDTNVNNVSQTDESKAEQQNISDNKLKVPCLADTVLRHFPTMRRLLGTLSHCSNSSFALLAASSLCSLNIAELPSTFNEPQTTADAVFHLLMLLCKKGSQPELIVTPIYQYLNTNSCSRNVFPRLQLSEPFLWYVLKVFETPAAVSIFTELGGIEILCQNLVKCNRVLLNMQPGLISLVMQHMTKNTKLKVQTTNPAGNSKKSSPSNCKFSSDGLINFAPFCSITSENSTAQPADILIQTPIASHRRARTPAWSYLFYPHEQYVDLIITLPTAILLKEIILQPHLPNLASCPSAVAIEISRDQGLGPIPFGQPLKTVGMTCINMKLSKPEIATSIVLRLYKPKDSINIGLTQITVLGTTIFGDTSTKSTVNNNSDGVEDDAFSKTSFGWIRILARCFSVATFNPGSELSKSVITAAAEYPGFIEACCTLMNVMPLTPNSAIQNLETVLLKLGGYSRELGLTLVHHLLWGTMPQTHRLCNESACDLLFDLCTMQDAFASDRICVLIDWVLRLRENINESDHIIGCTNPHSGFVKCIASILWCTYVDNMVPNIGELITPELFEACFYWNELLKDKEPLKIAFDSLLCSLCYIKPELFNELLRKINVFDIVNIENLSSMSDDHKDSESMTDDTKNADPNCLSKWFEKRSYLNTLAAACQSTPAVDQLILCGLPKTLTNALYEFCCCMVPEIREMPILSDMQSTSSLLTDSDKAENIQINDKLYQPPITIELVSDILDFFAECCAEGQLRDWLGTYQGSLFWKPLLELLCNHRPTESDYEPMQHYFTRIERSTINFLSRVTSCHPKNQEQLTQILISVIRTPQKSTANGTSTNSAAATSTASSSSSSSANSYSSYGKPIISGFTRRLVLQLLLESERILVSVHSSMLLQKLDHSQFLINNHPSKRTSAHHLLFYLSSHTKCQDILQNCISVYSNKLPTQIGSETRQSDISNSSILNNNQNDKRKELFEMGLTGHDMEFLSVVTGVTAKDKRLKEVKNQVAALKDKEYIKFNRIFNEDAANSANGTNNAGNCFQLQHSDCPNVLLSNDTTISQILAMLNNKGFSLSKPCLSLTLRLNNKPQTDDITEDILEKASDLEPLASPLQRFSSSGGLSLLAHYLPTVYPDSSKSVALHSDKEKSPPVYEWIKVGPNEEIYEDLEEPIIEPGTKLPVITSVPQHSLAAFGLFLRLPAYSDVLLRDKLRAQCLLRLVLGVTGDGEGNDIYSLSVAPSLPTLPFEVFRQLLHNSPLTTDDGVLLRRKVIEVGAMHLVLNCLGIFTHQSQNYQISGPDLTTGNGKNNTNNSNDDQIISDDKSHVYWAKGTGFGTGSTQQSWDVEQALLRQKSEEEHVTVLLQALSSYINPGNKIPQSRSCDDAMCFLDVGDMSSELPPIFLELLQQSCLIPALSSYLRNDSVLDITRHIPLYRSILQLLRAIALSNQLVSLLQLQEGSKVTMSIAALLTNMKNCVDTYAKRLKVNKKSNIKGQTQKVTINMDDGDDEGLALLIPDIQETATLVQKAANIDLQMHHGREGDIGHLDGQLSNSIEHRYLDVMKKLQFDTYEMITECENGYRFVVSHHYENNVRMAGDRGHPSRVKRLAQETVTLSTSLPLSYSSSVFVRCDTDRLDIMKVLITGPSETPYANGCFEFDVYFPPDYPNSPMLINLETTGRHSVRFNPNLYNDGKVCLSVLNTWHGRPEEKWNAQTSSFLQVLVSIQSLILVPEPYFNEPGFERSRGTPSGTHSSREYNSNIYQACVRWAMLEQIRNPSPCFKEVIHTHFWLKRHEICAQIESWIDELSKPQYGERSGRTISFNSMVLRRQYKQLREKLAKLSVPEGLEDLDRPFNPIVTTVSAMTDPIPSGSAPILIIQPDSPPESNQAEENLTISPVATYDSSLPETEPNNQNDEYYVF